MTTIISRLYADKKGADRVAKKLKLEGFRAKDMDVIVAKDGETAESVEDRLTEALTHPDAISTYAGKIVSGGAAVVVRCDYTPLGARKIARGILEASDAKKAGNVPQEHEVKRKVESPGIPTLLEDHPLFFRIDLDPGAGREIGLISEYFGFSLLTNTERKKSVSPDGGGPVTGDFMPLLKTSPRQKSVMDEGGPIFSRALGWRLVTRR